MDTVIIVATVLAGAGALLVAVGSMSSNSTTTLPDALPSSKGMRTAQYSVTKENVSGGIKLKSNGLTWKDVLHLWQNDDAWTTQFCETLSKVQYPDFFWEATPLKQGKQSLDLPFECVLLDARGQLVSKSADASQFGSYFTACSSGVTVFPNLRGDATLVVPCPSKDNDKHQTLSTFLRNGDRVQHLSVWKRVAEAIMSQLSKQPKSPLWVITDGSGVPWLHVRLDSTPKYFKSTL